MVRKGGMGLALVAAAALAAPMALAQERGARDAKAPRGPVATVEGELARLADEVGPAVVGVTAGAKGRRGQAARHNEDGLGSGAGVVVSADGLILTCSAAVPAGSERITITFQGGRRAQARELRRDTRTGLVLLALDTQTTAGVHAATLGSLTGLRCGSIVATFGNPFGTISRDGQAAMSLGLLSGIDESTLETDAAVNPGSFGGPLVDARGRVIGIVVPEFRNERWLGLARAIDADVVALIDGSKSPESSLVADDDGDAKPRGVIGVFIDAESDDAAKVEKVQPGSPAEKAKLKVGDVVIAVDGKTVASGKDFSKRVRAANLKPGDKLRIRVDRDGFEKEFTLESAAAPDAPVAAKPWLGLVAENGDRGLSIAEVTTGGPADKAGVKAGDVLATIDGKPVTKLDDLRKMLDGKKVGDELKLGLSRKIDEDWWDKKATLKLGKKAGEKASGEKAETPRSAEQPKAAVAPEKKPGFLGVKLENAAGGVKVADVIAGTPAEKAGLKTGDLIVAVAGEKADTIEAFTNGLKRFGAGDKVELMVARGEDWKKPIEVTLGDRSAKATAATPATPATPSKAAAEAKPGYLGLKVEEGDGGLKVVEVIAGGPSEKAGLKVGTVVVSVDGKSVDSLPAFGTIVRAKHAGDKLTIALQDGSKVEVTLGQKP